MEVEQHRRLADAKGSSSSSNSVLDRKMTKNQEKDKLSQSDRIGEEPVGKSSSNRPKKLALRVATNLRCFELCSSIIPLVSSKYGFKPQVSIRIGQNNQNLKQVL